MRASSKIEYLQVSGLLYFFFFAFSSSFSLFSIWIHKAIGLNGAETGMVFAANTIAAMLILPFYGVLQDRLGMSKKLLVWIGVLLCCTAPFCIYVYSWLLATNLVLGVVVGAAFLGFAMLAGAGLIESYTERLSRHMGFEFGKARLWGSLGWASATGVVGVMFSINPNIMFYMSTGSGIIFLLILFRMDLGKYCDSTSLAAKAFANPVRMKDFWVLMTLPRFWAFGLFMTGVCGIYAVYDQQFPVYFSSFYPNPEDGIRAYGYLNSSQVFVEALCMLFAPWLISRIGAKNGLILTGTIMFVRILGSGVAVDVWVIASCKMLHALEVPILLVSAFKYIAGNFDPRLSATLYLVGFQAAQSLTAMFLAPVAGYGYDHIGFSSVYVLMAGVVGVCLLISCLTLRSQSSRTLCSTVPDHAPSPPVTTAIV